MQHTLAGSTISKKGQGNIVSSLVFFRKCQSCTCTDLCSYNSISSKEIGILPEEVHTTALSFGTTSGFAIQFSHAGFRGYSFGKCQAMITVAGYKGVFLAGSGHTTGRNGFLP